MSNKQAKANLNNIKMQAANEVGVNLNNGYNGDLTARQAGSIGGMMVKKMITEQQYIYNRVDRRLPNHTRTIVYNVFICFE